MKKSKAFLLALLLALPGLPDGLHIYVRNREIVGKSVGGDIYLSKEQLSLFFSQEELAKIRWSDGGQATINDQAAPEGPGVSVNWLAAQLGFTKRVAPGSIDWVKLPGPTEARPSLETQMETARRRPEYREAGRRLQSILSQLPLSDNPDYQKRVERIGLQVVQASPLRDLPWKFVVVSIPSPNAACTGEGHVFVTDSLLQMGLSDDELAGVMGHEIAHGVRRHTFRRSDLLRDITRLLKDYENLQDRIDRGENSLTLRSQVEQYSRRRDQLQYQFDHDLFYSHLDEEEADVLGLRYSVTAGFSADGLGNCLERLEKLRVQQFGTAVLSDDMSHPPTKRRLEILQRARHNAGF